GCTQRTAVVYRSFIMQVRRSKLASRFIVLFALLHTLVPGVASIVDAVAERNAVRIVQVGEQGSSNYLSAHPEDCALCAVTTAPTGTGIERPPLPEPALVTPTPVEYRSARRPNVARPIASQRAPPALA
ncbi:MAG: hypothetical protein ACO1Q7_06450, partial [Gemmatimonas sp.]